MKNIRYIAACVCAAALLFAACTADDPSPAIAEGAPVRPLLRIGVSEMTMHAEPATLASERSGAGTRALKPMNPDEEKYIKTLAMFEFDGEGLHTKGGTTFHFIDFINGTLDGNKVLEPMEHGIVETTLEGLDFVKRDAGTLCLVANVTDVMVNDFYARIHRETGQTEGSITLDQFKGWALQFNYKQEAVGTYDETTSGHVTDMYMFGYYEGPIDPSTSGAIAIDLGRLASRIDISIINQTGAEINKRLGYHFDNVCRSAYFFPGKMGLPPTATSMTRTVVCKGSIPPEGGEGDVVDRSDVQETFAVGATHTRYFYVAAHSAKNVDEATKLHLYYDRIILNDNEEDLTNSVQIPLCNVNPSDAPNVLNGYSLSRNTRYHFTIRLKPSNAVPVGKTPTTRAVVEYGESPSDITVYLPDVP